jgi:uncharacterized membrane protein
MLLTLEVALCVALSRALRAGRAWAWLLLCAATVGFYFLTHAGGGQYLLYVPPVVIPTMLLIVFARSLTPGQQPVVTRVAVAARGPLPSDMQRYARQVTWFWVISFALIALGALALALFASPQVWSVGTNLVQYLLVGLLFAAEYGYRRWRFRAHSHPGFREYLRILLRADLRAP